MWTMLCYALLFDYTLWQRHLKRMSLELQSFSINDSPVGVVIPDALPHDIFVCRRRHALFDRRWNSMPKQQLRIRSDAARGTTVRGRRICHGEALVAHLEHLWSLLSIVGRPKLMTLHRYGRGRDVMSRCIRGRGSDRRRGLMAAMMSTPWRRLDSHDSLLVVSGAEAA
jgi:hypothetical protein